jgi:hypothetical protein
MHMKTGGLLLSALCGLCLLGCQRSSGGLEPSALSKGDRTIDASTDLLRDATKKPNTIPDGILNLTKCAIVFPATDSKSRMGAATCREAHDKWMKPTFVTLIGTQHDAYAPTDDLLILIIGDSAVQHLNAGAITLSNRVVAPGPTLVQSGAMPGTEVRRDLLVYRRRRGMIEGSGIAGTIRRVGQTQGESRRFLDAVTAYFNSITPIGIIIHHSAVLTGKQTPPRGIADVETFHAKEGFDILCDGRRYHVAYHYLILPDGKVQAGRPERCQGAHSEGYNSYLGISVVGDFSSRDNPKGQHGITRPTKQQLRSLANLCRQLMARYRIPFHRVLRHSDVARTQCPGDRFPFRWLLSELQ